MKIESILNAQEITELAKERFKEERATDHLEGWFLAKEIMRECDEKFKEDVDSIRISKTLVEIARGFHCGSVIIIFLREHRTMHLQDLMH